MPSAIEVHGLSKHFGPLRAVDHLTFDVEAGRVTGFLGPNGSGKTTTLRMLLGLVSITEGHSHLQRSPVPGARPPHPPRRRGARGHELPSVPTGRGPPEVGGHRRRDSAEPGGRDPWPWSASPTWPGAGVGKFSLGMRQRLQLATALLGDPEILILDEPSNGLDPQGIQWLRTFIRHQASIGHAVLVSSHLLSEMEETVDDVVIVSHGRLVLQTTLADLAQQAGTSTGLRVRTPEIARLRRRPRRHPRVLPADRRRQPDDRRRHAGVVRPAGRSAPDRPVRARPRPGQPGGGLPQPDPRVRRW